MSPELPWVDPKCPEHGQRAVYDVKMKAWRCCSCGHRFSRTGEPVKATRYMWPWKWPRELYGRRWARQAGQGKHTRITTPQPPQPQAADSSGPSIPGDAG